MNKNENISMAIACIFSLLGTVFIFANIDDYSNIIIYVLLQIYLTFFVFGGLSQGILDDFDNKKINGVWYIALRLFLILLSLFISILLYQSIVSISFIFSFFISYLVFIVLNMLTYYLLNRLIKSTK